MFRAPPSPNTLNAYKAAAAKTNMSIAPPRVAGGVFISLNGTSKTGGLTGTASKGLMAPTSTSTTVAFTGAATKTASGITAVVLGAIGVFGLVLL